MENEMIKVIKKLSGSVLSIGLSEKLVDELDRNSKIVELDEISFNDRKKGTIKTEKTIKKSKKINIKKLRKLYKKKSTNYIVCNYEIIKNYMRFFIKDSVYINNKKLYIYGTSIKEVKQIISKYKRYNVLVKNTEKENYFVLEIDNTESKNNVFKDTIYFIGDTFELVSDLIGNFLIN